MSIRALHLHKTFGNYKALDDVSIEVPEGRLVSLLGPSGSGKTTVLRILAGLEFPDRASGGVIEFHGEDVTHVAAGKRGVGFVFQHYALFKHMTIAKNIAFGLRAKPRRERPDESTINARVKELLELVQLDGLGQRYPSELSGGQRQRVALARAIASQPRVLLLDEPFGALDAKVRKDLRRWLRLFQEEIKITTVFVTHDQEEALELADEVVIMNNARIAQVGEPQSVYDHPSSPFVIEFLGNVNRFTAGVTPPAKGRAREGKDVLYVRPHDVDIQLGEREPHEYAIRSKIQHIFSAGNYARITLDRLGYDEPFEAEISRSRLRELNLQVGMVVSVVFRHIRVFANGQFRESDVSEEGRLVEAL
ncbi:MAG: TOBE-like domain-containing protein [Verrucomicrobiales bacterium]|nr:TOBE-like domain-containing protein [Verrucomicrobiales bacterium]